MCRPKLAESARLQDKGEPVPFERFEHRSNISWMLRWSNCSIGRPGTAGNGVIGSAHAAWLPDGTPVVVKVLHAGLALRWTDVRAMRTLFVTGRLLGRDRNEVDQIFTEIQDRLTEELDYYKAANLELFHRELAHIDGLRIPRTYGEYCTDRVLTMDRIIGAPLEQFLKMPRQKLANVQVPCLSPAFMTKSIECERFMRIRMAVTICSTQMAVWV